MPDQDGDRSTGWLTVARDPGPEETGTGGPAATGPDDPAAVRLAGAATRTRGGLFAALAAALAFPAHFGHNWDALSDVLRDRLATGPLTVRVDDAGQLLADEPAGQYARFLAVFGDVAADAPHPLRVVLHASRPS